MPRCRPPSTATPRPAWPARTPRASSAIALGYTSLLNHSYMPNCEFIRHIDDLAIDLVALRDIAAGEELTIDYQMTLWFVPR